MDPVTGSLIGGAVGGIANLIGGNQTNQMNQQMSQAQMNFQNAESSTAYQRAVPDMQAAGLNPMLMMGTGSGASSPSGAAMQMQNPASSAVSAMQGGLDSAVRANSAKNQNEVYQAQKENIETDTEGKVQDNRAKETKADIIEAGADVQKKTAAAGGGEGSDWYSKAFGAWNSAVDYFSGKGSSPIGSSAKSPGTGGTWQDNWSDFLRSSPAPKGY